MRTTANIACLLTLTFSFSADSYGEQSWKAFCADGPPGSPQGECSVVLAADTILINGKKGPNFSLPASAVSKLIYTPTMFRRSEGMNPFDVPAGCTGCGLLVVAGAATWLILHPMKGTDHFVEILWEDRGVEQEISLKLEKGTHLGFLNELQRSTGKPWQDVSAEAERLLSRLDNAEAKSINLAFERAVTVGGMHLPAGSYSMAFLPGGQHDGYLAFFSGPATRQNMKGMAAVGSTSATAPEVIVEYAQSGDSSRVLLIRTPSATFRLW